MEVTGWNHCFLCASSNPLPSSPDGGLGERSNTRLLQYLLSSGLCKESGDERDKEIYKDVLHFTLRRRGASGGGGSQVRLCAFCVQEAKFVSELHKQLEGIQRKLIDKLGTIKQYIVNNSMEYGSNSSVKKEFGRHKEWVVVQGKRGVSACVDWKEEMRFLEVLLRFQTFVAEKDIKQLNIPLMDIEKSVEDDFCIREEPDDTMTMGDTAEIKEEYVLPHQQEDEVSDNDMSVNHMDVDSDSVCVEENSLEEEDHVYKLPDPKNEIRKPPNNERLETATSNTIQQPEVSEQPLVQKGAQKRKQKIAIREETQEDNVVVVGIPSLLESEPCGEDTPVVFNKNNLAQLREAERLKRESKRKKKYPVKSKQMRFCEKCPYKSNSTLSLKYHLKKHETNEKPHKCSKCKMKFTQKQFLDLHQISHSACRKCDVCTKYVVSSKMAEHLKTHGVIKIFSCNFCDYFFGTFPGLISHSACHSGVQLKCELCPTNHPDPKPFATRPELMQHLYESHNFTEFLFKCDFPNCTRSFHDDHALKTHKILHKRHHVCKFCDNAFPTRKTLDLHEQLCIKYDKRFQCPLCPAQFAREGWLETHKSRQHGSKIYKCKLCLDLEGYTSLKSLNEHMKVVHKESEIEEARVKCDICQKDFRHLTALRRHQESHTETKDFACEQCGFITKTERLLRIHLRRHDESAKTYQCSYCSKAFSAKRYLTHHLRTHTKEKPFQCEMCGMAFARKDTLTLHVKKMHLKGSNSSTQSTSTS